MTIDKRELHAAAQWLLVHLASQKIRVEKHSALRSACNALGKWANDERPGDDAAFEVFVQAAEVGEIAVRLKALPTIKGLRRLLRELAAARSVSPSLPSDPTDEAGHKLLELQIALAATRFAAAVSLDEPRAGASGLLGHRSIVSCTGYSIEHCSIRCHDCELA